MPFPRTRHHDKLLGVWDSTAMAVGGMIGGGIFSVLGVAIALAGHLAFACFVIGGIVAIMTARSFAGTAGASRSAGPFELLRAVGHPQVAGALIWLLVFGYMVALAVYSFTFGRYAANALGVSTTGARLLSALVIVAFLLANLRGVTLSAVTEDVVVAVKLVILFAIAAIGIAGFSPDRLSPVVDQGIGGVFFGAATIFFAYEGFELICYDRNDMVTPERTLPKALYRSVAIVAAVYVSVAVGAQMLVSDARIVSGKEVAFVAVGRAALGGFGRFAAIVGALFATGSAINATIFSTARLVRDASADDELPRALGHETRGLPMAALVFISAAGVAMAMLPGILELIAFGSASFLGVYAIVNLLQLRVAPRRRDRVIASAAAVACIAAIVVLLVELGRDDRGALIRLAALAAALALGRLLFVRSRSRPRTGLVRASGLGHDARMPDTWKSVAVEDVRVGDRIRHAGSEFDVARVDSPFLGREEMLCFIEDNSQRWHAYPARRGDTVEVREPGPSTADRARF